MSEVRVKLAMFAGTTNDRIAALDEIGGTRRATLRLREEVFLILANIFFHPGEPFCGPELMVQMLRRAGVEIDSVALHIHNKELGAVRYSVAFRRGDDVWTSEVLALDALGASIISGVPISITEADFSFMAEHSFEIEEHPEDGDLRTAEEQARKLPKNKLGQA